MLTQNFMALREGIYIESNGAPDSLGSAPHLAGNLNHVNQKLILAARGLPKGEAVDLVTAWNKGAGLFGNTKSEYLDQRVKSVGFGYDFWRSDKP